MIHFYRKHKNFNLAVSFILQKVSILSDRWKSLVLVKLFFFQMKELVVPTVCFHCSEKSRFDIWIVVQENYENYLNQFFSNIKREADI